MVPCPLRAAQGYKLNIPNPKIPNLKSSKFEHFLSTDMPIQVEHSIPDLMWWVTVKIQACKRPCQQHRHIKHTCKMTFRLCVLDVSETQTSCLDLGPIPKVFHPINTDIPKSESPKSKTLLVPNVSDKEHSSYSVSLVLIMPGQALGRYQGGCCTWSLPLSLLLPCHSQDLSNLTLHLSVPLSCEALGNAVSLWLRAQSPACLSVSASTF